MITKNPYIFYQVPISRVTQPLIGGKVEKIWKNLENFLSSCTTADIQNPRSIEIVGYAADEAHGENPILANNILIGAKNIFGDGITEPVSFFYPTGKPSKQTKTTWKLTASDLPKALDYLTHEQPLPKYNLGPIELLIAYDFMLIDPIIKFTLSDQQDISGCLVSITRNSWISPWLCFPFKESNQDFWNYLDTIKSYAPFKIESKYLRLVRLNKKGTANVFSKL